MSDSVVTFLIVNKKILLGYKKQGKSLGKWCGIGGGYEEFDGSLENAAVREFKEEVGVLVKGLKRVGTVKVKRADKSTNIFLFVANGFEGEIIETEEICPCWFGCSNLPLVMWDDAKIWLTCLLMGYDVCAEVEYNEEMELVNFKMSFGEGRRTCEL